MQADSITDIRKKRKIKDGYTELHFFDLVYRQYLIVLNCDFAKFRKFLKDDAGHDSPEAFVEDSIGYLVQMSAENNDRGNTCLILWMPDRTNMPTLVHEITHLVHFVLDGCGVPTIRENTEAVAYYTEHWFNRITRVWESLENNVKVNHKEKKQ